MDRSARFKKQIPIRNAKVPCVLIALVSIIVKMWESFMYLSGENTKDPKSECV